MNRTLTLGLSLAASAVVATAPASQIITQWNFNGPSTAEVPGGTASPTASTGTGTASLIGGVTATFASGAASGGSTDPAGTAPPNYAWNTTTYAAQGQESGLRGVQFLVSTAGFNGINNLGFKNIVLTFDLRHSNTSSRFVEVQYTLDGVNFTTAGLTGNVFAATAGDTWFNNRTVDFSGIAGANNNANFGVRVVTIFAPDTSAYAASNPNSNYAGTGTLRYDMVTFQGEPVPEPASLIALGVGAAAIAARRRRK
ncbi:MAG: PEP-CTERM sorting domain-containing protein [Fimbriimonadaceae bacterium]